MKLCFVEKAGTIHPDKPRENVFYFATEEEAKTHGCTKIVNLDDAVLFGKKFAEHTVSHAKKFKKLAKKMNGKNPDAQKAKVHSWAKSNIFGIFEYDYLKKLFPDDGYLSIPEEDLLTIAVGLFIPAHALADEIDFPKFAKLTARDLALNIYVRSQEER